MTSSPLWLCTWCGGGAEDEQSLRDHQEWCLGDAKLNTRLLDDVALRHHGELTQAALVAAAKKRRASAKQEPGPLPRK
jgi:hypothetical protein